MKKESNWTMKTMFKKKTFNRDIIQEINRAGFRGATPQEMKALYIRQNCFDVEEECEIFRIFELPYQLSDIRDSKFTLINPEKYKDRYENPLLNRVFTDETGDSLTLNGIVEHYYVSPWTFDPSENPFYWLLYTRNCLGIRIKSTVGKIMHEMMNLDNPFYMLQFHAGTVDYFEQEDIDNWLEESHYTDFLDSLGQLSVSSLMALRNRFSGEKEIRFVFSHIPANTENFFIKNHVIIRDNICKHPINWVSVIDEIILDPRITDEDFEETVRNLRSWGVTCDINHSNCRQ